jgi:hypothetical protein
MDTKPCLYWIWYRLSSYEQCRSFHKRDSLVSIWLWIEKVHEFWYWRTLRLSSKDYQINSAIGGTAMEPDIRHSWLTARPSTLCLILSLYLVELPFLSHHQFMSFKIFAMEDQVSVIAESVEVLGVMVLLFSEISFYDSTTPYTTKYLKKHSSQPLAQSFDIRSEGFQTEYSSIFHSSLEMNLFKPGKTILSGGYVALEFRSI